MANRKGHRPDYMRKMVLRVGQRWAEGSGDAAHKSIAGWLGLDEGDATSLKINVSPFTSAPATEPRR